MIRVCLLGLGRTGKEIAKTLMEQEDVKLVAAVCSPGSDKTGSDLGEVIGSRDTGIIIGGADKLEQIVFSSRPDVAIDFSSPEAALRNAKVLSRLKVNIVIGTTGFSKLAMKRLYVLADTYHTGIVYTPNITLGVNVAMLLANLASTLLSDYDFQITEVNHKNKKDLPSGTAKMMAAEVEKGLARSNSLPEDFQVPISAIRAGGTIGRHGVMIVGEEDQIEISHEAFSRKAYALGALRAVRFIHGKMGYFEMSDVLDLQSTLNRYLNDGRKTVKKRLSIV